VALPLRMRNALQRVRLPAAEGNDTKLRLSPQDEGDQLVKDHKFGLRCPKCEGPMKVLRTEHNREFISRRRECKRCGHRATSNERFVNETVPGPVDVEGILSFSIDQIRQAQRLLANLRSPEPAEGGQSGHEHRRPPP
jgi:Zn ribbon nucleic-acid-binding protein